MTKQAKVTLYSMTARPLETMALAKKVTDSSLLPGINYNLEEGEAEQIFREILKDQHQTPLEYINTVWLIENCSRAFQQQLTRHRIGFSYSIQSLRVVDAGDFASEGRYTMPESVKSKGVYHQMMQDIEAYYRDLIKMDEKIEDARGILPLNIHSPITMACSYRALLGMVRQRMCVATQGEWKAVVEGMRFALAAVHPLLAEPFDCSCGRFKNNAGYCKHIKSKVDREGVVNE